MIKVSENKIATGKRMSDNTWDYPDEDEEVDDELLYRD